MRTRIVVFKRDGATASSPVLFGIQGASLLQSVSAQNLSELAALNGWTRHETFDWSVGDAGSKCALFEAPLNWEAPQFAGIESSTTAPQPLAWLSFPQAARFLTEGEDRRFLQLAVQFVAQGGIDDSVLATDYDKEFLDTLKRELERRGSDGFPARKEH
jgi:hypothetical protein